MQVVETKTEGLSRTFEVKIPAADLAKRLQDRIDEIQPKVRLKGFRPGKVPASHIRKMFGRSMMDEIIQDTVNATSQEALQKQEIRAAAYPEIHMEADVEKVASGEADLAYHMHVEVMPEFEPIDVHGLKLKRPVAPVSEEDLTEAMANLAEGNKVFAAKRKGTKAKDGDAVVADFVGKIDGEPFEGGAAEAAEIVLGAGRLIPGFEEQLMGAKAGDEVEVKVTFPDEYPNEELKGKAAVFDVTVKEVKGPKVPDVDDEFAKLMGFDSLDGLKEAVKGSIERDFAQQSRARIKRRLLDILDEKHAFDLPTRMVDAEFDQIWNQVKADLERGEVAPEDEGKSEDDLRAEYGAIAERRVRLGLVLAEIGRSAKIEVSDEELARAINMEARRYPGREREIARVFQQNPQARTQLRAPIYEEKVVDYILELAEVEDEETTKDELFKDE